MVTQIKGKTVVLIVKEQIGVDQFGVPVMYDHRTSVDNVLISPASDTDMVETLNLTGKRAVYTLHIPKGDDHVWSDTEVEFYNERWHTIGDPTVYQEEMLPLDWKGYIRVERFD